MYLETWLCVSWNVEELAPDISAQELAVAGVEVLCHWYVIVTPVSPSGSLTVAVSVWSSAAVPLKETDPMLLTLATTTVNDWVDVWPSMTLPLLSRLLAVRVTALLPTFALAGVPVSLPVEAE